jgi:HEAT repeat protein
MTAVHSAIAFLAFLIATANVELLAATEPIEPKMNGAVHNKALAQLQYALLHEKEFVKVHAAEALVGLGEGAEVLPVFIEEEKTHGNDPHYRIGIWRVLVRSSKDAAIREQYIKKLRDVSLDANDPDRITATESLAKLKYKIRDEDRPQFKKFAQDSTATGVHFYRWLLAESDDRDLPFLAELLNSRHAEIRGVTAYGLWHLADRLPPEIIKKLANAAQAEPESKYRVYLYIASYVTARDENQAQRFKELLMKNVRTGAKDEKYQTAMGLALRGTSNDLPLLADMLNDHDADVRVSAASAIVRIKSRKLLK